MRTAKLVNVFVFCLFMVSCTAEKKEEGEELLVYCGAANKPPMEKIAAMFEQKTNTSVRLIYGGSGTLLSQLEITGRGEIYLPGSPDYISRGMRKGLLIKESDRIVAYLVPAIITPAGNPAGITGLRDLARKGVRVGIGNPETVCLGLYGIELLSYNDMLQAVMGNVVTFGASCSKTANLAAMGKVDAILGWRVFHFWNPEEMEFIPIDPDSIPRLSHISIAIPSVTRNARLSGEFISFVLSEEGRGIYRSFGYCITREEAARFAPRAGIGGEYQLPDEYFQLIAR